MTHLKPIAGTFKIKSKSAKFFSQRHSNYRYEIVDSRQDGSAFISPVASLDTDKPTGFHQATKLVCWASMEDLERI